MILEREESGAVATLTSTWKVNPSGLGRTGGLEFRALTIDVGGRVSLRQGYGTTSSAALQGLDSQLGEKLAIVVELGIFRR